MTELSSEAQQSGGSVVTETVTVETGRPTGLKRPAISQRGETTPDGDDEDTTAKRSRMSPGGRTAEERGACGVRNAIDASFSSSRRWLDRQVGGVVGGQGMD